jgi:hypothetical protein
VVLDDAKQAELAAAGQALGVSLPQLRQLLDVLLPGRAPSVARLGRWAQAAARQAGPLLAVLDEWAAARVEQVAADEVYVRRPVLMAVEPGSLCWLSGRMLGQVTGAAWAEELGRYPRLQQVTRDAGNWLTKGVADLNGRRQRQGQGPVADQLDHFHTLREGGLAVTRAERAARRALAEAEKAEADLAQRRRRGQALTVWSNRARARWARAERAMDTWAAQARAWEEVKAALALVTPEGELNTRARAEALLAELLPRLPDSFAKAKRLLALPQTLTYLDEARRRLETVGGPAEVQEAALHQELLRRRPELAAGEGGRAGAMRGVLLACAVVLCRAGEAGAAAVRGVQAALRGAWRASSLVECINSALRMQQARHRRLTQGLLDLKRLYWNCHAFSTGRRRGQCPYQLLGLAGPALRCWELLKWSPEQLRTLSHAASGGADSCC